ncbi:hypothetical protein N7474_005660 [Penicillium riverlandense]|uniref:uncharacterized protein n=1 Tax=Penicillium riverlandense TaxID=1903569 RepID=UPI002546A9A2|nr:uncharacterized protein N7474_005660 [Penicillium riverlandense]KAJ5820069.1 hypothetical protein N7474_005660 [Penicillium riverlandense]
MTTRTHDDFLGIDDDEAIDRGYDSEEKVAESKGRAVKRRRTADRDFFGLESDHEESDSEDEEQRSRPDIKGKGRKSRQTESEAEEEEEANDDKETTTAVVDKKTKPTKPLSTKPPKASAKKKKPGIIYFASLPPYLKPGALKAMLEARGFEPITKTFLSPLVLSDSRKRGNKRKMFTDGWVEFASKRTAKICAETLNATIVGGRKGGWYHDDIWNMKYLSGFKWDDLMEQQRRERAEREARTRMQDIRAQKEEKMFLAGVEAGRVADGMARKREEKRKRLDTGKEEAVLAKAPQALRRRFVQNDVVKAKEDQQAIREDAKRVLGKIF